MKHLTSLTTLHLLSSIINLPQQTTATNEQENKIVVSLLKKKLLHEIFVSTSQFRRAPQRPQSTKRATTTKTS